MAHLLPACVNSFSACTTMPLSAPVPLPARRIGRGARCIYRTTVLDSFDSLHDDLLRMAVNLRKSCWTAIVNEEYIEAASEDEARLKLRKQYVIPPRSPLIKRVREYLRALNVLADGWRLGQVTLLRTEPGCPHQWWHRDLRHSFIGGLRNGSRVLGKRGREEGEIPLDRGAGVYFGGHFIHAGAQSDRLDFRWHAYLLRDNEAALINQTDHERFPGDRLPKRLQALPIPLLRPRDFTPDDKALQAESNLLRDDSEQKSQR